MKQRQHNMTSHFLFPHMKYQPDGLDAIPHSPPRLSKVTIRSFPSQLECLHEGQNASYERRIALPKQTELSRNATLPLKQTDRPMKPPTMCTVQHASIEKITRLEDWDNRTTTTSATITTCDSSVSSSSFASWCEMSSFVPKRKEEWYGEPLVRVQQRFGDELQQLRRENDILRWKCQVLQQQLQTNSC